jgi:hypothetical protein
MVESIYKNDYRANFKPGKTLPKVSTQLDSVRAYQFEVRFYGMPQALVGSQQDLTLAAKQVSPVGGTVDDIVVERVHDRLFYPGKFTPDELTITFDNLYLKNTTPALWEWFKTIYDPISGDMTKLSAPGGPGNRTFKASKLTIIELDNTRTPHAFVEVYGVYPKGVRFSERNYSTNEFSTIEVTFRYDFMDYAKYSGVNQ